MDADEITAACEASKSLFEQNLSLMVGHYRNFRFEEADKVRDTLINSFNNRADISLKLFNTVKKMEATIDRLEKAARDNNPNVPKNAGEF